MQRFRRIAFAWPERHPYGARMVRAAVRDLGIPADVISTRSLLPFAGMEETVGQKIHWVEAGDSACSWESLGVPRPDAFVVGGWATPAFNRLATSARASGARVVMMIDNPWQGTLRQRLGSVWFRLALRQRFDAIWVPGRGGVEFARRLGFVPDRIQTGLYAADPELFRGETPLEDRPRRFVFVGQLIERKGLRVLAEALRILPGSELSGVDVFGTGPLEMELASAPGLRLHGFLPGEQIARELAASRFLVLPSFEDHWGLVVHEATCCGCGVITTDGVGARHELVTRRNGWVYPSRSAVELARCLREAAAAAPARLREIESESRRLSEGFSPTAWAGRLRGLLERIGA